MLLAGKWRQLSLPLLVVVAALALRSMFAAPIEEVQLKTFDVFQRLKPRPYTPVPVKMIDLDDETLERLGQWPWPRTLMAELVAHLANAGTAAIAFDIVFAEPDRTSPANILSVWPPSPLLEELRGKVDQLPDHDAIFADIVGQANVAAGFVLTSEANDKTPLSKAGIAFAGDNPKSYIPAYAGAVLNLPAIDQAAAGLGTFTLLPETDAIIRRVPLMFRRGETIFPSLSAEALRIAQGATTFIVKSSGASGETAFGEHTGINHIKIGRYKVPTDSIGRMWLHFTDIVPERSVAAWKLFAGDFDASSLEGNIVVIGTSAAGLRDARATPLDPAMPGGLAHVQALEQILLGYFLELPDWAFGAEILYIAVLGVVLSFLINTLGALWSAAVALLGIGGAVFFSWTMFVDFRLLIDPVYPATVVLLVYITGSLISYLRTEVEKRQVRGAFAQYLSPALVEQLADEPDRLVLGGEMKDMTLLFADIRGFTTISEQFKRDPTGLTKLINRFLTPMTDMILARNGTIDKYMGDCIMAFWNAPLDDPDHVSHACDSALAMFSALESLNADIKAEREAEGELFLPINIGIGLNSGEACVGNMGSEQRFDYSVLGDTVNLAARLEGQSKNYGVGIVIGDLTSQGAPDYATLEMDYIAVKGKSEGVRIYCLQGPPELAQTDEFKALADKNGAMIEAYRGQRWREARVLVAECRELDDFLPLPLDVLYDLYDERIDVYEADPPGPDWDGVFVATSK